MVKKATQKSGELVYGVHPIIELLKAKRRKLLSIYTIKPVIKAWPLIEPLFNKHAVTVNYVSRDVLASIAGTTDHQGIIAWATPFAFKKQFFDAKTHPFLLLLDGIQDVGNLGAILRSAYCTGVDGVVICKKNGAPINAAALKASAGLAEHLNLFQANSVQEAVQLLNNAGYTMYMAVFNGENAATHSYTMPSCLVIGSEGKGISKSIISQGVSITLPQKRADISYNASVAAGILLFLIAEKTERI